MDASPRSPDQAMPALPFAKRLTGQETPVVSAGVSLWAGAEHPRRTSRRMGAVLGLAISAWPLDEPEAFVAGRTPSGVF
jgi:hypothetical protein